MSIGPQGENLIFLLSQPRAGSTLLQRMLGAHTAIHTVGEPWLMLHSLYQLRGDEHSRAPYDAVQAHQALRYFLQELPDGEADFYEAVRRMTTYLYEQARSTTNTRYFLDKTPRYYYIIPELVRVFPAARFIVLLRNPLATQCSRLRKMIQSDNGFDLRAENAADWLVAPRLILDGMTTLGDRAVVVRYEDVLEAPQPVMERLCAYLDLDFQPGMVDYGAAEMPRWRMGDKTTVYDSVRPQSDNADRWLETLADPQAWRLVSDYLDRLGRDTLTALGYDFAALRQQVDAHRPAWWQRQLTQSLAWMAEKPLSKRRWWQRNLVKTSRFLQTRF